MSDLRSRTKNVTGKEHCRYCCREVDGWVVVDVGNGGTTLEEHRLLLEFQRERVAKGLLPKPVYGEALAPCPFCEAGFAAEFPNKERKGEPEYRPPFPDGYWHGQSTSFLRPDCNCESPVATHAQNREAVAALTRMVVDGISERSRKMRV